MHYIRFLKHPSVAQDSKRALEIKALVTLTSDLGDSTYPEDAQLTAFLIDTGSAHNNPIVKASLDWKANSHALPIIFTTTAKTIAKASALQIIVEANHTGVNTAVHSPDTPYILFLPHILSTISAPFGPNQAASTTHSLAQRLIPFCDNATGFSVSEDTGPSIDRHVWDAGVGLSALFSWLARPTTNASHLQPLADRLRKPDTLRVLDLGTGVGLVGLALAHVRHAQRLGHTVVDLTDVESARPIAEHNIAQLLSSVVAAPGDLSIAFATLEWEAPLPARVAEQVYDLVLVSDCTYNPDSGHALVRTLTELARRSPGLLIAVASKTRHESEAVFWDWMQSAGFCICEHARLLARGGIDDDAIANDEIVNVHLFEYKHT